MPIFSGLSHSGLPHESGALPAGLPDLPHHSGQLRVDCPGPGLHLEGEIELLGQTQSKYINNLLEGVCLNSLF